MAYKVETSDSAHSDLDNILLYMIDELASPLVATNFSDALDQKYELLEEHPFMFEVSRNERLAKLGYRRLVIGNYVALYLVNDENKTVTIARIFHGKQNYEKYI